MAFPLPQTLSRAQMPSLVLYIFLFNYFYFLLYLKKMLIYIFVGKSNMGFEWCCSLNLLHKPMLLPCNHIFCKLVSSSSSSSNLWCFNFFIFHILSLIWFVFWVWVFDFFFFLAVPVYPFQHRLDQTALSVKLSISTKVYIVNAGFLLFFYKLNRLQWFLLFFFFFK